MLVFLRTISEILGIVVEGGTLLYVILGNQSQLESNVLFYGHH